MYYSNPLVTQKQLEPCCQLGSCPLATGPRALSQWARQGGRDSKRASPLAVYTASREGPNSPALGTQLSWRSAGGDSVVSTSISAPSPQFPRAGLWGARGVRPFRCSPFEGGGGAMWEGVVVQRGQRKRRQHGGRRQSGMQASGGRGWRSKGAACGAAVRVVRA
ncbi:hypothetical protein K505DRAFT_60029 [Melanomma pulvis-pyrius CBS 109.77]|uniref:Uncharacterized protein n=1 Tax=Melanomma pulvis-pyrius CBS 109.77 TaxID=1314802 RepID=A0A6A6X6K9_9PLEO|nr:hypothetical protein K505DRAFT_60029 [Melanomma pulvis-pyrius CBS 109.77]